MLGRKRILFFLVLNTIFIAGIYIAALNLGFVAITHVYWILTTVLLCIYMFFTMKNENLRNKIHLSDKNTDETNKNVLLEKQKRLKIFLLFLLPFLFTIIGDTVYLLFLQDLDLFNTIIKYM